jgi:hypothetical protein
MTNPTQAQIDKLTTNLGRWDDIVNGSETDTVTLDNSTVKTVSGYLAELKAYNSLGAWQTAYSYAVKDVVSESSVLYVCLVAHTSGTFSTDLSSGKWAILQTDFQNLNVSGTFSGTFTGTFTGNLTGDVTGDVTGTATNSTHVFVVDNESENENNLIPFIEDATATGNVGLESDGDFHYNPSTGTLTATLLSGTLTTASQTNITSVGVLTSLTVSGDVTVDTSLFYIDSTNGRVGLGTASPTPTNTLYDDAILHIHQANTGSRGSQIHLTNASTGSTASDGCHIASYSNEMYIVNQEAGPIRLHTNNIERMRIDSSGSVLINRSSSVNTSYDFQIGQGNSSSVIYMESNASGVLIEGVDSVGNASNGFKIGHITSTGRLQMRCGSTGGVELFAGNTSWSSLSDERAKDIIEPISDSISKVNKIRAVIGKYKTDDEGIRRSFLIAQDVEEVFPEAVEKTNFGIDGEEYLALTYDAIIPLLVANVQELKRELDALKN